MLGDSSMVTSLLLRITTEGSDQLGKVGAEGDLMGKTLKTAFAAGAVGAVALGAGIAASVNEAEGFSKELLTIGNNTGMTTKQISQMRGEVLTLGREGPAPLNEIAAGFEKAANAGFHGKAAMDIVSASMKAAVETGGKTADTVDAVTGALKDFNLPAKDAGSTLGILMRAAAEGDVRLPDLVTNFNKVGVEAGAMHQPLSEVAAAFSTLTRYTHDAALSQTLLSGMFMHIMQPTKQAQTLIDGLSKSTGVDLAGAFQKVASGKEDLTTFMGTVRDAVGLTNDQMTASVPILKAYESGHISAAQAQTQLGATAGTASQKLFTMFGGLRGGLGALVLMNQGWKDYNDIAKKTGSATDLVNQQWPRTIGSLSNIIGTLKNFGRETMIAVGDMFIPLLQAGGKELEKFGAYVLAHLPEWQKDFQAFVKQLQPAWDNLKEAWKALTSGLGDLMGSLGDAFGSLNIFGGGAKDSHDKTTGLHNAITDVTAVIKTASGVFKDIAGVVREFSWLILPLIAAFVTYEALTWAVQAATTAWAAIQTILDAELMANPIGLIVIAIAILIGLIVLLVTHWKQVSAVLSEVWDAITGFVSGVIGWVKDHWQLILEIITGPFGLAFIAIQKWGPGFVKLIESILATVVSTIESWGSDLLSIATKVFTTVTDWLKNNWFSIVLTVLTGGFGLIYVFFGAQIAKWLQAAKNVVTGFLQGVADLGARLVSSLTGAFGMAWGAISGFIGNMYSWGLKAGGSFVTGIADGIKNLAGNLVGGALGTVKGLLSGLSPPPLSPWFDTEAWGFKHGQSFVQGINRGIVTSAGSVTGALRSIQTAASATASGMGGGSGGAAAAHSDNAASASISQLSGAVAQLPAQFQAAGQSIVNNFSSQLAKVHQTLIDGLRKENADYHSKLHAENTDYGNKVKAENQSILDKVKSANQSYVSAKQAADTKEAQDIANAQAHGNLQLQSYLNSHAASLKGLNDAYLASQKSEHDSYHSKLKALQAQASADDKAHNLDRLGNDYKAIDALKDAHNKHVSDLTTAYGRHVASLNAAFATHIKQMGSSQDLHIKGIKQAHDDHIKKLTAAHNKHVADLWNAHWKHLQGLWDAHQKHIAGITAAHNKHVAALQKTFADAADKIKQAVQSASTPSGFLAGIKKALDTDLKNATDKAALDILEHGQATQADKDAIVKATAALDTFDNATAQAASTVATYSQILQSQSAVQNEQLNLIAANTGLMKAQNDVAIGKLNDIGSNIRNATAVLTAQTDVIRTQGAAAVKAIEDQTTIQQAQDALQNASTQQQKDLATAQLKTALDQGQADADAAKFAIEIAQAHLQVALVTQQMQAVDNQLKGKVLDDQLGVAKLQVKLQQDQLQVALDNLTALGDVAVALGAMTNAQQNAANDAALIAQDNAAIAGAMQTQGIDQAAEALYAAQMSNTLDAMNYGIAQLDQQAQGAANSWALQLASDRQAEQALQQAAAGRTSSATGIVGAGSGTLGSPSNPVTVQSPTMLEQMNLQVQQLQDANKTLQEQLKTANDQLAWDEAQLGALNELAGLVEEGVGVDVSSDRGMNAALRAVQAHGAVHA